MCFGIEFSFHAALLFFDGRIAQREPTASGRGAPDPAGAGPISASTIAEDASGDAWWRETEMDATQKFNALHPGANPTKVQSACFLPRLSVERGDPPQDNPAAFSSNHAQNAPPAATARRLIL
jgi:hypothetical protein